MRLDLPALEGRACTGRVSEGVRRAACFTDTGSSTPGCSVWQCIFGCLSPADLAAMRCACRRWSKDLTQHAQTWQLRAPVHRFEWDYLRGTLYCMCPVARHITVVVSNRTQAEVRPCVRMAWRVCASRLCMGWRRDGCCRSTAGSAARAAQD